MNFVAIFEDKRCDQHIPIEVPEEWRIVECPERTQVISQALHTQDFTPMLKFLTPTAASENEIVSIVHQKHYNTVRNAILKSKESGIPTLVNHNPDVIISEGSCLAAQLAVGAIRDAVNLVITSDNIKKAFCNIRPPGHHATAKQSSGFCLYNNVWFGVQEARKSLKEFYPIFLQREPRIAIIDWDVHHGDGTEDYVRRNSELHTFFCSIHQDYKTNYPGTGKEKNNKIDNSIIICHNIPIDGGDFEVKAYFNESLIPQLIDWKPDIILISCGFDGHNKDPLGKLNYSSQLYGWMTEQLVKVANKTCAGRIVSVLEGGYNLEALKESAIEHVRALII